MTNWTQLASVWLSVLWLVPASGCSSSDASSPLPVDGSVWIENVSRLSLSVTDGSSIAKLAYAAVSAGQAKIGALPAPWSEDKMPRVVMVSASDGESSTTVGTGTGLGLEVALDAALSDLLNRDLGAKVVSLRLDVVDGPGTSIGAARHRALSLDRSLEGLAFPRELGVAFLPIELLAHTIVDSDRELIERNVMRALIARGGRIAREWAKLDIEELPLRRFSTQSFFSDGARSFALYRGHRSKFDYTKDDLLDSAKAGADYLVRATFDNGKFDYSYRPKTDSSSESYNLVRHAGTIFAMMEAYGATRDEKVLAASKRAIKYLYGYFRKYESGDRKMTVLLSDDRVKLGGVALTIVALAEYTKATGDRQHLETMQSLAEFISHMQNAEGKLLSQMYFPSGDNRTDFESEYYPGEAMLALCRLAAIDKNERWFDIAERAAQYQINVRDGGLPTEKLIHDHWLLYALNDLYRARKKELYMTHAMRITQAMGMKQNMNAPYPDWYGSFYRPPRSAPTATRSEGLLAAWSLANDHGRREDADRILASVRAAMHFQLAVQFHPESVMFLRSPKKALGGFSRDLINYEIRIDYVQHNMSAILALHRLLKSKP